MSIEILKKDGHSISFLGLNTAKLKIRYVKYLLLMFNAFNIFSALQIIYKYIIFKPKVIRFHSVSRFHGRLPVLFTGLFPCKRLMMYHDLGYFHPYPNKLEQENQILPFGIKNRFLMTKQITKNPIHILLSFLKYIHIFFLRFALLTVVDKHLIPSSFMIQYLVDWGVKKSSIIVLPHFIQN